MRNSAEDEARAVGLILLALKVGPALLFLAAAVAMLLGKVSAFVGAAGLAFFIVSALVSSMIKNHRLKKAMRESDLP